MGGGVGMKWFNVLKNIKTPVNVYTLIEKPVGGQSNGLKCLLVGVSSTTNSGT